LLAKELLGDLVRVASGSMNEGELFGSQLSELKLGENVAKGFSNQPGAQDSGDASLVPAGPGDESSKSFLANLDTWQAATAMVQAMDKDLPRLINHKSDIDPAKNAAAIEHLEDVITRLRTLSGEIGGLLADYHPAKGSKYNAS
jgi:hypothetical protein